MRIAQDDNLPLLRIVMPDVEQYFVNKFTRMLISIIKGSKLFSTMIGDVGVLGRQIKIKARHQIPIEQNVKIRACLEDAH
jgi:hypothetical protein